MRLCSRKPQLTGVATFVRLGFNALGADPFSPFTPGDCRPSGLRVFVAQADRTLNTARINRTIRRPVTGNLFNSQPSYG
jgi:hypothetical protein